MDVETQDGLGMSRTLSVQAFMSEIVRRILRKEFAEVAERDRSGPNVMSGGELSRID